MRRERRRMRGSGYTRVSAVQRQDNGPPQHQMPLLPHKPRRRTARKKKRPTYLVDTQPLARLLRGQTPREKDKRAPDAIRMREHRAKDRVREMLPPLFRVRPSLVCAHGERGVEPEHTRSRNGRQIPGGGRERGRYPGAGDVPCGWGDEAGDVARELLVHVFERAGGFGRGEDGEGEAVGLAGVVVGVLGGW